MLYLIAFFCRETVCQNGKFARFNFTFVAFEQFFSTSFDHNFYY